MCEHAMRAICACMCVYVHMYVCMYVRLHAHKCTDICARKHKNTSIITSHEHFVYIRCTGWHTFKCTIAVHSSTTYIHVCAVTAKT
jgi:hypothetical protein